MWRYDKVIVVYILFHHSHMYSITIKKSCLPIFLCNRQFRAFIISPWISISTKRLFPLGIGPLILWDSGHPLGIGASQSPGIRITLGTSSVDQEFGRWGTAVFSILICEQLKKNNNVETKKHVFVYLYFLRGQIYVRTVHLRLHLCQR